MRAPSKYFLGFSLFLVLQLSAYGHPFGDQFESHQMQLQLSDNTLTLHYVSELPTQRVMMDFLDFLGGGEATTEKDALFTDAKIQAIMGELDVRLNDVALPLRNITSKDKKNGVGNANFFVYDLMFEADLALSLGKSHTLWVFNHNGPIEGAYYQNVVENLGTLNIVGGENWTPNEGGEWSADGRHRNFKVTIEAKGTEEINGNGLQLNRPALFGALIGGFGALLYLFWTRKKSSSDVD